MIFLTPSWILGFVFAYCYYMGGAMESKQSGGRNPGLFWALLSILVTAGVIQGLGGGVFLVNKLGNNDDNKPPTTNGSATTAPPPGQTETVDCKGLKGAKIADVRNHLQNKDGFKVKEVEVASNEPAGTVVDVTPCDAQPKGSEITVSVSNGRGGGNGGNGGPSGGPNATCGGGFPFGTRCPPSTRR